MQRDIGMIAKKCYAVIAAVAAVASIMELTFMASLTVRNLDAALVRRLRIQAAENDRSAEAEHREILRIALAGREQPPLPQPLPERTPLWRVERDRSPTQAELLEQSDARKRAMETK